jgi:hypothetical protein
MCYVTLKQLFLAQDFRLKLFEPFLTCPTYASYQGKKRKRKTNKILFEHEQLKVRYFRQY